MKPASLEKIYSLKTRYPVLAEISQEIISAAKILINCYKSGGKLLVCGNGGSAADSEHIVGELMKSFVLERPLNSETESALKLQYPKDADYLINNLQRALPAIALVSHTSLSTAFSNDNAPDLVFAQQVLGYGQKGDVLLAISTSGNSKNCVYAAEIANVKGLKVISLTGKGGGKLKPLSDVCLAVPETETYKIQELHLPLYHALCLCLEEEFYGEFQNCRYEGEAK
jgi:D-sedoheptulose 7-phosphate isomerase